MSERNEESNKGSIWKERGTCAIYTRATMVFGEDSKIKDNESQRTKCEAIINVMWKFVPLSKRYDDTEVDIDGLDRPALQELFNDIKFGLVNTVVFYALDVISTSFKTITEIMKVFKEHNVRVIVAGQNVDTATLSGRHVFLRIADLAPFEKTTEELKYLKNQSEEINEDEWDV